MGKQPFVGLRLQSWSFRRLSRRLKKRGWVEVITPFTGYGSPDLVRVMGRIELRPPDIVAGPATSMLHFLNQRGWRNFFTAPVSGHEVSVELAGQCVELRADEAGYFDVRIQAGGLEPGWHEATVSGPQMVDAKAPVLVIGDDVEFGLVSDIDDTILATRLPRLLIAAWNSLVMTEGKRQAIPGMADLYRQLLDENPGAPIIYVSTGIWNTLPFLNRFMARHDYPRGPLLLTHFGPTQTSWFRSGPNHKRFALFELARDFPNIKWVLFGDNGQHDPILYREFSQLSPGSVRLIAIRELSGTEHVLAHGTTTVLSDSAQITYTQPVVPEVFGADGHELAPKVFAALEQGSDG